VTLPTKLPPRRPVEPVHADCGGMPFAVRADYQPSGPSVGFLICFLAAMSPSGTPREQTNLDLFDLAP
jgi:hypothetical protein